MYRPDSGGALVAMSGEKSCAVVEKRVYGALLEVGLSDVTWNGAPTHSDLNALPAIMAEGRAVEGTERSRVRYAVVRAPKQRGCLLTLVAVRESREKALGLAVDGIIESVRAEE